MGNQVKKIVFREVICMGIFPMYLKFKFTHICNNFQVHGMIVKPRKVVERGTHKCFGFFKHFTPCPGLHDVSSQNH